MRVGRMLAAALFNCEQWDTYIEEWDRIYSGSRLRESTAAG